MSVSKQNSLHGALVTAPDQESGKQAAPQTQTRHEEQGIKEQHTVKKAMTVLLLGVFKAYH